MTLSQFENLSEDNKLRLFFTGFRVGEYKTGGLIYVCKQVDYFYIEVIVKGTTYVGMKYHRDTSQIDPYLSEIDISLL